MAAIILLALTLLFSWVLIVLPQRRQMAAHRQLVASLEVGDEVITTAGIYGTITELDADTVQLQVADDVVLRFARAAVGRKAADIVPAAPLDHEEHDADPLDGAITADIDKRDIDAHDSAEQE
jgi:preprotein translocase subunit YajC